MSQSKNVVKCKFYYEIRIYLFKPYGKVTCYLMQNLLNCYEEKKINDTKVILNPVNGDLCANGTLSSSYSFKKKHTLYFILMKASSVCKLIKVKVVRSETPLLQPHGLG